MDAKKNFLNTIDVFAETEDLTEKLHEMFMAYCREHAQYYSHDNTEHINAYDRVRQIVIKGKEFALYEFNKEAEASFLQN